MPIHADDLADAVGDHLRAAAIQIDAADLCMRRRWHTYVARRSDVEIQFVIRPYRQKLPPVRLIARQVAVNDGRLRRLVQLRLDIVDLRYLIEFGNIKRAVVNGYPVRTI